MFAKWIDAQAGRGPVRRSVDRDADRPVAGVAAALFARLTEPPPAMSGAARTGRALLLAALFLASWPFILGDIRTGEAWNGFLHGVNLVFHEAGHMLLLPFGQFMHVLGGTLGQLAMPMIVCVAFIVGRQDPVGAAVGLWWFGQSLTDCAPYIADARKLALPLLGGGTGAERDGHDWQYLLGVTGLAEHDLLLGRLAQLAGGAVMLLAIAWGGWVLWRSSGQGATR